MRTSTALQTSHRYLLTVKSDKGIVQKKLWDGRKALPLGHPFRWVIEKTAVGVRVRSLMGGIGKNYDGVHEIEEAKLAQPQELKVDGAVIRLHPVANLKPIYKADQADRTETGELNVFFCLQNCVVSTMSLDHSFVARVQKKKIFEIKKAGGALKLHSYIDGLEVLGTAARKMGKGQDVEVAIADASQFSVCWGSFYWFIRPVKTPSFAATRTIVIPDPETKFFKKALTACGAALALLLLTTMLWPKDEKKEEELIPPQMAKLIMTKPLTQKTSEPQAAAAGSAEPEKTKGESQQKVVKAKNTAVVQAFRAKALQNAVSGLLKGGMTHLLAQSEMLMGADSSKAARRILDGKAVAGLAAAPVTGLTGTRSVDVAQMGGGDSKSAGYGQGQHAGVAGQGKSFVGLDIDNASVESSMLRSADIEGRLLLDFVIGPAGLVTSTSVKESSLNDPRLDDCVIRRLTKWQFPKPKGGVNVSVSYPFIFKTLGR
jgi:TonB family protein